MAAVTISPGASRSKEEFVDEFLTCSICDEPYDNRTRQAKCLPCLHTYCKSCLQSVTGKRTELDCPKCRKLVKLPGETVESLPNNFLVENLREYQNIFNMSVICGNCDDNNPAVRFCHDCGSFQCHNCTVSHQKIRFMRNHQLVTIEELQANKGNPMLLQKPHCMKHPKQELSMYCKDVDCSIPVCATCGLVDHKNHNLVHLDAAVDEITNVMRLSSERVRKRCKEVNDASAKIDTVQKILMDNFSHTEKNIAEYERQLTDLIKAQCNKAHDWFKVLYEAEQDKLKRSKESLDILAVQMNSACMFADQSCDMSQTTQLLTSQKQIMDRLNELEKAKIPDTESDKTDFVFTAKHRSAMTQIQSSLQDLWDISWKPVPDPKQCTIKLSLPSEKKGYWKKGIIQTADSHRRKHNIGGAIIEIFQGDKSQCVVEDSNDGTYAFHYNSRYDSKPLHVKIDGTEMNGSPFISVPDAHPQKCSSVTSWKYYREESHCPNCRL